MKYPGYTFGNPIPPGATFQPHDFPIITAHAPRAEVLQDCAESLAQVADQVTKLKEFFGAFSCLGPHALNSHLSDFKKGVGSVLNQAAEQKYPEEPDRLASSLLIL